MLKFDEATRTRLLVDMTLDFDPTGSTLEVRVDGTWYDATWQDTPVECKGKWTQTARTVDYFAGPDVEDPDDAIVLSSGLPRHRTQTRVSLGGDIIVADSTIIEVNHRPVLTSS